MAAALLAAYLLMLGETAAAGWRHLSLRRAHRRAARPAGAGQQHGDLQCGSLLRRRTVSVIRQAAAGVRVLAGAGLEAVLIGGAAGVALLGPALALRAAGRPPQPALEPALALTAAFVAAHLWLRVTRRQHDPILLPVTLLLCGLGWTVVTRARLDLLPRAYMATGIGLFLLVWMAHARWVRWLERYRYLCMAFGLGLLAATALYGREVNGAKLSLGTDQVHFQPTEAVKMLLAIFTAGLLAERRSCSSWAGRATATRADTICATWRRSSWSGASRRCCSSSRTTWARRCSCSGSSPFSCTP
jgi:hypothetical protein